MDEQMLTGLLDELIKDVVHCAPHITEGNVMSLGPMPYRRLDCDGRALAYLRARRRKGVVRIDMSGLWIVPRDSPLRVRSSGSSATLVLRSRDEKTEVIGFLMSAVDATRVVQAKHRAREEERKTRAREARAALRRERRARLVEAPGMAGVSQSA